MTGIVPLRRPRARSRRGEGTSIYEQNKCIHNRARMWSVSVQLLFFLLFSTKKEIKLHSPILYYTHFWMLWASRNLLKKIIILLLFVLCGGWSSNGAWFQQQQCCKLVIAVQTEARQKLLHWSSKSARDRRRPRISWPFPKLFISSSSSRSFFIHKYAAAAAAAKEKTQINFVPHVGYALIAWAEEEKLERMNVRER